MALESIAAGGIDHSYGFQMTLGPTGTLELDFRTMIGQIIEDIRSSVSVEVISAKFHNWVAEGLLGFAIKAREEYGLKTVGLSGGVFCNRYLTNRLISMLKQKGFCVLFKRRVPANDGGIALGQAAIAAQILGTGL
jgi:hydrogenase maturation protein HypF